MVVDCRPGNLATTGCQLSGIIMSRINQGYAASAPNGAPHPQDHNWTFQLFLFAKNFVKHPDMIGWFLPSSRFVVDTVLKQIDWANARVIAEYGPGLGTFTREILRRMR